MSTVEFNREAAIAKAVSELGLSEKRKEEVFKGFAEGRSR